MIEIACEQIPAASVALLGLNPPAGAASTCHPERSEGPCLASGSSFRSEVLRFAQDDKGKVAQQGYHSERGSASDSCRLQEGAR
jgi:hypothetical protein